MARAAPPPAAGSGSRADFSYAAGSPDPRADMASIRQQNSDQDFLDLDAQTKPDAKDAAFAAADILASTLAMVPATSVGKPGLANGGMQTLYRIGFDAKLRSKDVDVKPNPWFVANGHVDKEDGKDGHGASAAAASGRGGATTFTNDETRSPLTQAYLQTRDYKTIGSGLMGIGGGVASAHTGGVNVLNTTRHLNAAGSTLIHWLKIRAIAESVPQKSATIIGWCDIIMKAKAAKGGSRALGIVSAATPVPFAGPIATILGTAAGLGIKIGLAEACYLAALEIHWRAFGEQTIAAVAGPRMPVNFSRPFAPGTRPAQGRPVPGKEPAASLSAGPASRIFAEVFKRRGMTRVLGAYDVAGLIKEPAGWMVLGERLAST